MGRHQQPGTGSLPCDIDPPAARGRHRAEPAGFATGRMKVATVAAATGAFFAVGAQMGTATVSAAPVDAAPAGTVPFGVPLGLLPGGIEVPPVAPLPDLGTAVQQWTSGQPWLNSVTPNKQRTVQPVSGTLTSDFGPRWGAFHGGLDVAAPIGTPILSAEDGMVVDAGPASGYGLWVKVHHDDGSTAVYGHVNEFLVHAGQRVSAGQQIATVGNRGESTGPHVHFEVWDPSGAKIDPSGWLRNRGVVANWVDHSHWA